MTRVLHTARINYVDSVKSSRELEFFFCPTLVTRREKKFLYFFTELKTHHLSYSIYNTNVHINNFSKGLV